MASAMSKRKSTMWHISEVKITQSSPTLCDPMNYTVRGILQARVLEWVAFRFSRRSSQPRDPSQVSPIAGRFFTSWAQVQADSLPAEPQGKAKNTGVGSLSLLHWIFPTQELNQDLLHCRHILYQVSCQPIKTVHNGILSSQSKQFIMEYYIANQNSLAVYLFICEDIHKILVI